MNYKSITLVLAAVALSACAAQKTVAPAPEKVATAEAAAESASADPAAETQVVADNVETSADSEDKVICRQITPTGSHRKKMVCRTVGDIKRDRRSAQDALRRSQGGTASAPDDL